MRVEFEVPDTFRHPLALVALGVVLGVGYILWRRGELGVYIGKREPEKVYIPVPAPPQPKALVDKQADRSSEYGIKVDLGKLRIDDWGKWMEASPPLMDLALDAGASTATEVLNVVLNVAVPQYAWPPEKGSRLHDQYLRLADVVASTLGIPNPPPEDEVLEGGRVGHLRVVK